VGRGRTGPTKWRSHGVSLQLSYRSRNGSLGAVLFFLAFSGACIGGPRISLSRAPAILTRHSIESIDPLLLCTLFSHPCHQNVRGSTMRMLIVHVWSWLAFTTLVLLAVAASPVIDRTNVWGQPTANWIRSHQGSHIHLVGRYVEYKSDHVSSVLERYRLSGCYRHHKWWYFQLLQLHISVKPFVQHRRTPRDGTSRRHSWHSCSLE